MAGGEGLPAPLEQHANVQPRQGGQSKSARATKHQQNAAKQSAYMRAPCTHRNAFSNTTSQAGHAVQSKHCIGHGPTLPWDVLASCRQRDFRAGSARVDFGNEAPDRTGHRIRLGRISTGPDSPDPVGAG